MSEAIDPAEILAAMDAEPWEATITRAGRWTWSVELSKGLTGVYGFLPVLGTRRRAARIAHRRLARQRRDDQHQREAWKVT